jgi:hypothetical protein
LRYLQSKALFTVCKSNDADWKEYLKLKKEYFKGVDTKACLPILFPLLMDIKDIAQRKRILDSLSQSFTGKLLKDKKTANLAYTFLNDFVNFDNLSSEDKALALEKISLPSPSVTLSRRQQFTLTFQSLQIFLSFANAKEVRELVKYGDLSNIQEEILKKFMKGLDLELTEQECCTFYEKLDQMVMPEAVFIYAATLLKHGEMECVESYKKCLTSFIQGTYQEDRYSDADNAHMDFMSTFHREKVEVWRTGAVAPLEDFLKLESSSVTTTAYSFREHFSSILMNQHLSLETFPELQPFQTGTLDIDSLVSNIQKQRAELDEESSETARLDFLLLLVPLLKEDLSSKQLLQAIQKLQVDPVLKKALPDSSPFVEDLSGIIEKLQIELTPKKTLESFAGYTLRHVDDFELTLCAGTRVSGSCQSVSRDGSLSKGLLGPLNCDKTLPVVLCDPSGDIVLRRFVKLEPHTNGVEDSEEGEVVLHMEPRYQAAVSVPDPVINAFEDFIKSRAKDLDIPLVQCFDPDSDIPAYPYEIESLGSRSPYEYVDTLSSIQKDVRYTLEVGTCELVYDPREPDTV